MLGADRIQPGLGIGDSEPPGISFGLLAGQRLLARALQRRDHPAQRHVL